MNAATIINDDMTLEEKLDAINKMMENMQAEADTQAKANGEASAPIDPAELTMCLGCQ